MGIFSRPDSPYWWLWLETAPHGQQREKTAIRIGATATERADSRRLAQALYAQRVASLARKWHRLPAAPADVVTFATYAATYAADTIRHHKGKDREGELLARLTAHFGPVPLDAIDQDAVRAYMTARVAAQVSPATVNREVDLLKSMLRDAVPKHLEASPLVGMKRLAPGKRIRRRLLSPDEEARLLEAAAGDPQTRALLILGLDTLVRLGDLLDLQRSDRHGTWIYIGDPKSGDPLELPLSPRAAAALDAIPGDAPYYFSRFRVAANPRDWRGSVRQRLERLCAEAVPPVPFGRDAGGITWHWATRRTGATRYLVERKVPLPVVQQLGGWKNPDVLLGVYVEAQRADLAAAVGQAVPAAGTRGDRRGKAGAHSRSTPGRGRKPATSGRK